MGGEQKPFASSGEAIWARIENEIPEIDVPEEGFFETLRSEVSLKNSGDKSGLKKIDLLKRIQLLN